MSRQSRPTSLSVKIDPALPPADANAIINAIGYAKFRSRSHDAVIRIYDEAGNVIKRTSTRAISPNIYQVPRAPARYL
jgi:hypothetical protein